MAQIISFSTGKFDISRETPNPINPIFGEALLNWVREMLARSAYTTTAPEPEDWGWFIDVQGQGSRYLVGASGQPERPAPDVDWVIQVHRKRSFADKLAGRNTMTGDDPLVSLIESFLRSDPDFRDIQIDRNA